MKVFRCGGMILSAVVLSASAWATELETDEQKLGYIIGMDIGNSLRQQGAEVDLDALIDAVRATYEGKEPAMTPEEAAAIRQSYIQKRQADQQADAAAAGAENLEKGKQFLAENKTRDGVEETASGLQYQVLTMGEGAKPAETDTVNVHYRGTLLDGTEFDSSYSRGEPVSFPLNRVITGWTEGLQLMPVGSKFKFFIPAGLAYGEGGGGPIPPNSTLIFEVELLGIESAE